MERIKYVIPALLPQCAAYCTPMEGDNKWTVTEYTDLWDRVTHYWLHDAIDLGGLFRVWSFDAMTPGPDDEPNYDAAVMDDNIRQDPNVVWEKCPVAILVARMLSAESVAVYNPKSMEPRIADILDLRDIMLHTGAMDNEDIVGWHLQRGMNRLLKIRDSLTTFVKPYTTTMVSKFCFWHDSEGLLQDMSWANDPELLRYASDIDLHVYLVDDPKCDVKFEDFAKFKRFRSIRITRYPANSNLEEFSAYFTFIVENYDVLPDFVIFAHPDAQEHQGANFFGINSAMGLISNHSQMAKDVLGYYPLSMQYLINPGRIHWKARGFEQLWGKLFGTDYYQELSKQENCTAWDAEGICRGGEQNGKPDAKPCERGLSFHVAAQAVVSKERIKRHTREYYEFLVAMSMEVTSPENYDDYSGLFEAIFHVIFGERIVAPIREKNEDLPIGLRWNVPSRYSDDVI